MNKILFVLCLFSASFLHAQTSTAIVVMGREHKEAPDGMEDRPYGDGDTSIGVFVDVFDGAGAWRFGASYAGDATGLPGVKSVITPEIGLLSTDGFWQAGVSAMVDYVDTEDEGKDWGNIYFQATFGLNFQLTSGFALGIHALYPFEDLEGLSDFDTGDVEYGATVRVRF